MTSDEKFEGELCKLDTIKDEKQMIKTVYSRKFCFVLFLGTKSIFRKSLKAKSIFMKINSSTHNTRILKRK